MKRAVVILCLVPLISMAAAQSTFEGEVTSLSVGENTSVNATVINPLPVDDTLVVRFGGGAIEKGIITPFYPDTSEIDCEEFQSRCELDIRAGEEKDLRIVLEGTAIGQERLSATVNSTTTQLSSTDTMEIRVEPAFGESTVSAPGIQWMQIVALALLGAAAATALSRDD